MDDLKNLTERDIDQTCYEILVGSLKNDKIRLKDAKSMIDGTKEYLAKKKLILMLVDILERKGMDHYSFEYYRDTYTLSQLACVVNYYKDYFNK
ncbi:hypothetical protein [Clostridium sp.]|uniref:hypothetical protein n=1 Tax=Clostridium sp. TaxID=1506 RepID=UPI001B699BC2|nr:hypothetical protein [Clostridium sp.]MBP3915289.1 hypothetical protein [Clostridium sp.]